MCILHLEGQLRRISGVARATMSATMRNKGVTQGAKMMMNREARCILSAMTTTLLHPGHEITRRAISRRAFLAAGGLSFCGLGLSAFGSPAPGRAKSTILIWL